MNQPNVIVPEHAKYADAEFSDIEIEALMEYFRVSTYERLVSVLSAMKNSTLAKPV
jgi:hypothetical protein